MRTKIRFLAGGLTILGFIVLSPVILQGTNQESELLLRIGRSESPELQRQVAVRNLSSMPLAFTENEGQWDDQALFRANAGGVTMWFTQNGTYYQFTRRIPRTPVGAQGLAPWAYSRTPLRNDPPGRFDHEPDSIETMAIKTSFVGANLNPEVVGEGLMEYKCNYFIGNDPAEWYTDVPNYRAVCLKEVYPGIDLRYYGNGRQLEYDFVVSPGADPAKIAIRYDGALSLSVNSNGELVVKTEWGEVIEQRPVVYQTQGDQRIPLEGTYKVSENHSFAFALGDDYDPKLSLVIDPTLVYSTYLGGNDDEVATDIAIDANGNAYVTGYTLSSDFPTSNPYQTDQPGIDVFVTKLNSTGNGLVYSTYLGGSGNEMIDNWWWDHGPSIAVDGSGSAYISGYTESTDFPTQNPYQTDQPAADAFITKLNGAGNGLVYSTYLGGDGWDGGYAIAIDGSGNAYVTGSTWSDNFPTQNPYQTYKPSAIPTNIA